MTPKGPSLRNELILHAKAAGYSAREIGHAMKIDAQIVYAIVRKLGEGWKAVSGVAVNIEDMTELYAHGWTLDAIGDKYGVSRERVRQIFRANSVPTVDVSQTGLALITAREEQVEQTDKYRRMNEKTAHWFGCGFDRFLELNDGVARFRIKGTKAWFYLQHQRNSATRGIAFKLTFPEWCQIWADSGKWELHGRGKGCYCMARSVDSGGYEIGNVEIITNEQNSADSFLVVSGTARAAKARYRDGKRPGYRDELNLTTRQRAAYELMQAGKCAADIGVALGIQYGSAYNLCHQVKVHVKPQEVAA